MKLAFWKRSNKTKNKQGQSVNMLTEPTKIYALINKLKTKTDLLKLSLPEHSSLYFSSAVINIDRKHNTFDLDEFTPANGNTLLEEGQLVHVKGHVNGIVIDFDATFISTDNSSKIALHHFALPDRVTYLQRRNCFRAKISAGTPITFSTYRKDSQRVIQADVFDLSIKGLCFISKYSAKLHIGEVLSNCRLYLPGGQKITLDLEIRQSQKLGNSEQVRAGCRFVDTSPSARRKIELLVRKLERSQLRHKRQVKTKE